MRRNDEFRRLYAYNRWANERMLEAVAALTEEQYGQPMGSSYPSVRDTLVHIMSAEWVWLARWQGTSPTGLPEAWRELSLEQLRRQWAQHDRALQAYVGGRAQTELDRVISYRNIAGEPHTSVLADMLRHVVNHSSYHRGQVTTLLRQLGVPAPATDLILYYRMHVPIPTGA